MRLPSLRSLGSRAPRPYVAFVAVDEGAARRLYRAQNVIWIWLGFAAILQAAGWLARPDLGVVLTSNSEAYDALRYALFAIGGALISAGVWTVRRQLEVSGHVLFATAAILNAIVTVTVRGEQVISLVLLLGVALASGFRAYYIVRWISGAPVPASG